MKSLNFNDGYESFAINGDESRVIRFNPRDPNIIQRYNQSLKNIMGAKETISGDITLKADGTIEKADDIEAAAKTLMDTDQIIRENVNMMFNSDVYDIVFAGQSPFSGVGNGRLLFETFMFAVKPVIEAAVKKDAEASKKRMGKYTKGY